MSATATISEADLKEFVTAVIEALFFTDAGPDGEFASDAELAPSARERIEADSVRFLEMAEHLIPGGCLRASGCSDLAKAGHDFWLTRNGHGAGFWDGDWNATPTAAQIGVNPDLFPVALGRSVGDALTVITKAFGEVTPYLGDDGLVYLA